MATVDYVIMNLVIVYCVNYPRSRARPSFQLLAEPGNKAITYHLFPGLHLLFTAGYKNTKLTITTNRIVYQFGNEISVTDSLVQHNHRAMQ